MSLVYLGQGPGPSNDGTITPNVPLQVWNGATWDRLRLGNVFKWVAAAALGDNAVWTPAAGKKFRLLGLAIQCGATATDVYLKDGATQISPVFKLAANQLISLDSLFARSNGLLSAAADNVLNINLSAANPVGVWVCGTEE